MAPVGAFAFCIVHSVISLTSPERKNRPQTFTTAKSGKSYKCSKAAATEGGLVTAAIDLDKCTFSVSIKGADLDVTSGDVNFDGFNEMANLNVPWEF
ncbi:MAG TPA: hypothetical protein VIK28_02330 [Sedimentisphaerales bacterium]